MGWVWVGCGLGVGWVWVGCGLGVGWVWVGCGLGGWVGFQSLQSGLRLVRGHNLCLHFGADATYFDVYQGFDPPPNESWISWADVGYCSQI